MQEPQSLCRQIGSQLGNPGKVATRAVEACNQTRPDRIGTDHEYNGNSCRRGLGRADGSLIERRDNQRHLLSDQLSGEHFHSSFAVVGKAVLERNVLALDEARLSQASMK